MKTRYLAICLLLVAAACVATWYCWPALPARVAVHWNSDGRIDGYGPRALLWLLGPGLMALMMLTGLALPALSPRRVDVRAFESTYYYISGVVVCMLGYVYALVLAGAASGAIPMQRAVPAGVFVLLVLIGNPMGKVRRNFYMGIRTPWTLASERVWYATHRLAAKMMVASGLLGLIAVWLQAPHWILLALMVAWALVAVAFSLLYYKRLEKDHQLESH